MKKQESFEKKCGKSLLEQNRLLSTKTKEEMSEEEILKKLTENLNIGGHSEERIIISSRRTKKWKRIF